MKPQINKDEKENPAMEAIELEVEELEEVIAPGIHMQHNETLASDDEEIQLEAEELEEVIAPGRGLNHNETLVSDIAD